ncbi:hypothetical protein KY290_029898 [Solanum tuberosum]|uniref:FLU n=1 Tax=Solanum tuberosum TaxID=4113 RepID=A0ABQ7UP09_SOLTU|nr:hypothetical protein KY284_028933 [Solanum tuberosum]KAH0750666.1 hypothetical protein KY290_029898 [Solanum tuberosum]
MAIMMKQGLLLWSPCPHSLSPKIQSFKQPIFQLTNKWKKDGEAMLKNFVIQEKSKKKGIAIDFKEILQFRNSAATIIVANALMMTSPLDALAETCEVDNSPFNMLFNMPILLLVALIGATVGGLVARQRKAELLRLNEQLRQINAALRRQAKIESYAPNLSYAPAGGRVAETEVIVDPRKEELISRLKNGKKFLRNQAPDKAQLEFKAALDLAQNLKEPLREKKAARGLGASLQRQGKYREAIKYHSLVLELSARHGEDSGSTEAYGAIADCYTELGDLEQAAKYYDQYIARLETD